MARRILPILVEAALILATLALIVACWLPIDAFRHWLAALSWEWPGNE